MQSFKTILALLAVAVATVTAAPTEPGSNNAGGDVTVATATEQCGSAQLSCCNSVSANGGSSTDSSGILSGLLGNVLGGSGGLLSGSGCSKVEVPVLSLPLSHVNCPNKPVCCKIGDNNQSGLINVGQVLPCVALPLL